ncbi:MAG: hypothetical protein RIR91_1310 [Verrucomicrobiota bacterium]
MVPLLACARLMVNFCSFTLLYYFINTLRPLLNDYFQSFNKLY